MQVPAHAFKNKTVQHAATLNEGFSAHSRPINSGSVRFGNDVDTAIHGFKAPITPPPKANRKWRWILLLSLLPGGCLTSEWNLHKTRAWFQAVTHSPSSEEQTSQRRAALKTSLDRIIQDASKPKTSPIDWPLFADCVAHLADASPDDETFRQDLAYFFGKKALYDKKLDRHNSGLPEQYKNTGYSASQMHHYVGGTTGENWQSVPSHLLNCTIGAYINETYEYLSAKRKNPQFNQGDVDLFAVCRQHRDEFLAQGRHTVAPNIRKILLLQQAATDRTTLPQ